MPDARSPSPVDPVRRQWPVLTTLTACVLLGHWTLLLGATADASNPVLPAASATLVFTTRTLEPLAVQAAPKPSPSSTGAARRAHPIEPVLTPPTPPAAESALLAPAATGPADAAQDVQLAVADTQAPSPKADAATPTPTSARDTAAVRYVIPESARLLYEVSGIVGGTSYTGGGELSWQQDGKTYAAKLAISKFFIPLRVQTSKGTLGAQGLEPLRFGDKKGSEVAAHFDRNANKIVFSANTPDAPLAPGGQDQLSVFVQLGALLGADATRYAPGSTMAFQAVGARYSEQWEFLVGKPEKKNLPGGEVQAIKLTREPVSEHDSKVETWIAPDAGYLPVHIRLSQKNGDFVDMLWSSTQKTK